METPQNSQGSSHRAALIAAVVVVLLVVGGFGFMFSAMMFIGGSVAAQSCDADDLDTLSTATSSGSWVNPVAGRLSSPFGMRTHPVTGRRSLHDGQDIAAPMGTTVLAAASGTVRVESSSWAGPHLVTLDHGGGIQTEYGHMRAALVHNGQQVNAGDPVGKVGTEGLSTGPHLHFMVVVRGKPIDPVPYMRARGLKLGTNGGSSTTVQASTNGDSSTFTGAGDSGDGAAEVTTAADTTGGSASAGGVPSSWTATSAMGEKITLDHRQLQMAADVVQAGVQAGVPEDGLVVGLMVPFVEGGWRNYASRVYPATVGKEYPRGSVGSDHDSVGLFQQRPQSGWGSPEQLLDPRYEAAAFFGGPKGPNHGSPHGLLDHPGWQSMSKGAAAQDVQVSAFPDRYAAWESAATKLLALVRGQAGSTEDALSDCVLSGGSGASFTMASANVLGSSHTAPGGHHSWWASGAQRMSPTLQALDERGVSVAGVQEWQRSQWAVAQRTPGWGVYPQNGRKTENGVIWQTDQWDLVRGQQFTIPYFGGHPKQQSMVLLKQRSSGQLMWFISVHNAANVKGPAAKWRARALQIELSLIQDLQGSGVPVFITGDFNEKPGPYCVLTPTMRSAFGTGSSSPCRPPKGQGIDHIYGSGAFAFSGTVNDWSLKKRALTDHPIVVTNVVSTGGDQAATASSSAGGKAGPAIKFALSQVGDRYVWGANGPNAWDCSGLMVGAWKTQGVLLPRTSSQQAKVGQRVDQGDLQPGDLIFYYHPVSHVAMYIGERHGVPSVVHAARPGVGVVVAPLSEMKSSINTIRRVQASAGDDA